MKRKITQFLKQVALAILFTSFVAGNAPTLTLAASGTPNNVYQLESSCESGTGGLPGEIFVPWYKYLESEEVSGKCRPILNDEYAVTASKIALAIVDTIIRLASLLALGYVIYGSIRYVTSGGDSSGVAGAKTTIANALVGLVIALLAIGIVQYIGNVVR